MDFGSHHEGTEESMKIGIVTATYNNCGALSRRRSGQRG